MSALDLWRMSALSLWRMSMLKDVHSKTEVSKG